MCDMRCPKRGSPSPQRYSQGYPSQGYPGMRTRQSEEPYPEFADPATLEQLEELEALGVFSRTEMEEDIGADIDDPAYVDGHMLDFSRSRVLSSVSLDQYQQESLGVMDQSMMNTGMLGAPGEGYEAYQGAQYQPFAQSPEFQQSSPCGRAQDTSMGIMDQSVMNTGMLGADDSYGVMPEMPMDSQRSGRGYEAEYNMAQNEEMMFPQSRGGGSSCPASRGASSCPASSPGRGNIQDISPPSGLDEVSQALESESQMTVFDPEILNSTMAPRTTDLNVRRQVLLNSFISDLEDMEKTEKREIDELLKDFHRRRREEYNMS